MAWAKEGGTRVRREGMEQRGVGEGTKVKVQRRDEGNKQRAYCLKGERPLALALGHHKSGKEETKRGSEEEGFFCQRVEIRPMD